MQKKTPIQGNVIALKQILNLIPRGMINRPGRLPGNLPWLLSTRNLRKS
jgi:hypothetical protein